MNIEKDALIFIEYLNSTHVAMIEIFIHSEGKRK